MSKHGSIPHPTLTLAKNMPGDMPMPNTKFSGPRVGPAPTGKLHGEGGDSTGKGHGLHGASVAKPKKTKKEKSK